MSDFIKIKYEQPNQYNLWLKDDVTVALVNEIKEDVENLKQYLLDSDVVENKEDIPFDLYRIQMLNSFLRKLEKEE